MKTAAILSVLPLALALRPQKRSGESYPLLKPQGVEALFEKRYPNTTTKQATSSLTDDKQEALPEKGYSNTTTKRATYSLTDDEQDALDIQNNARYSAGSPELTWDASQASAALEWAKYLAHYYGSSGYLEHSTSDGESLWWWPRSGSPLADAAKDWVGEEEDYNGQDVGESSHEPYLQYLIWRSTFSVGMAAAPDGNGGYYVVGRYDPPG